MPVGIGLKQTFQMAAYIAQTSCKYYLHGLSWLCTENPTHLSNEWKAKESKKKNMIGSTQVNMQVLYDAALVNI